MNADEALPNGHEAINRPSLSLKEADRRPIGIAFIPAYLTIPSVRVNTAEKSAQAADASAGITGAAGSSLQIRSRKTRSAMTAITAIPYSPDPKLKIGSDAL